MGAIYYAEATLPHINSQMDSLVTKIAPQSERLYFTEHVEIDSYHKRMVLNKVILQLTKSQGEECLAGMLQGFEELRFISGLYEAGMIEGVICQTPPT